MNREESYTPSGFDRHDFNALGRFNDTKGTERSSKLCLMLMGCDYRDKRIQRTLRSFHPGAHSVLMMHLEEVPLNISHTSPIAAIIAQWRMQVGR